MPFVRRRCLVPLLALVVLVVASACQADVTVAVAVADGGSGIVHVSVHLDADAVSRVEGLDELRTADLVEAGWTVADPVEAQGGRVFEASKPFADPAELATVLEEVSGPGGPYAQLGLAVDRSFARSTFRVEGVLDGSVGVEGFADPAVAGALDGLPFGVDLAELEAELGSPPGSMVDLRLVVSMPGDVEGGGDGGSAPLAADGSPDAVLWETDLAADAPVPVLATSETTRFRSVLFAGIAAALVALLLLVVLVRIVWGVRRRRRRRRNQRHAAAVAPARSTRAEVVPPDTGEAVRVVASGPVPATDRPDSPEVSAVAEGLQMVILGGPGTLFDVRDQVDEVVAFARAHGSILEYPKIAGLFDDASRGRLSTSELWRVLGVEGDAEALDADMLGRYQLTTGAREFVVRARERGFRVAYLGDGPAGWLAQLRRSFLLDELIDPWVVSSDIGSHLPESAMFEALRRLSGVAPANCLLIDDRLEVLETAHGLGFGTTWFAPSGRAVEAPGHSIIRSFADLLSG
ncbi:MAG: hypothetical protein JJE52_06100 [Acidimicrobiia bacterium]|nr:hypothetical protein [Acidimicrobiia bacterium]